MASLGGESVLSLGTDAILVSTVQGVLMKGGKLSTVVEVDEAGGVLAEGIPVRQGAGSHGSDRAVLLEEGNVNGIVGFDLALDILSSCAELGGE